ncbi:hypothetical protein BH23GEM4_BH23GEM4_02540 [soil metagenome]
MTARRGAGRARLKGWLLLLLGSLGVVVWRQTRGVALDRELRALTGERSTVEARRLEAEARIRTLAGRGRVVSLAERRLGMHVPEDSEIVFVIIPGAR